MSRDVSEVADFYAKLQYPGPDALITYLWANRLRPYLPKGPFHLLDAGCGAGRHTAGFLDLFPECRVTCLDAADASLDAANALFAAKGFSDRASMLRQSYLGPIVLTEAVDVAIAIGTIHHCPDPGQALANIASSVKPGGICAFMVYAERGARRRYELKEVMSLLVADGDIEDTARLYVNYEIKYGGWFDTAPRRTLRRVRNALSHRLKVLFDVKRHGYAISTRDRTMIADGYLSPIDVAFDAAGIQSLVEGAGLEPVEFVGLGRNDERLLPESWVEPWRRLAYWDRIRVLEVVDPEPTSWSVICRKAGS